MVQTQVDFRELVSEIMREQEAQGKLEPDALAHCIAEVRRRKEHLMEAFWEQYIESAVRDIHGSRVQRENQSIREAQEKKQDRGDRVLPDARSSNVSPAADEGNGGDQFSRDAQMATVAPTSRQQRIERWQQQNQQEAEEVVTSILDHKFYIGEGIGRLRLRDMTLGQVRKVRERHWAWAKGHWCHADFLNDITGDPWGGKSDGTDDTPVMEYRTEAEIEGYWERRGRPLPPSEDE